MNPVSPLILSLALLFGGAGAVLAFESAAQSDPPRTNVAAPTDSASTTTEATPVVRPGRRHHRPAVARWAPCPTGTTLVDNACVTDVVKTVTLPAASPQSVSHDSGSSAGSPNSGDDGYGGDDQGDDDGDDDHGDDHDDDDGDDDHDDDDD